MLVMFFTWYTHQQRRESSSYLVQLRNDIVKVDEFEGDGAHSLHGLVTPVTIQCIQGAWAIQVKCVIIKLGQVAYTKGGRDSIPAPKSREKESQCCNNKRRCPHSRYHNVSVDLEFSIRPNI